MERTAFVHLILILLINLDVNVQFTFKPVDFPSGSTVKYSETTEIAIEVEVLESGICSELIKCLNTEDLIRNRKLCFAPPPPKLVYHCGFDPVAKKYVEFYYPHFICKKGTHGVPKVNGKFVKVECIQCPADRFNPQDRNSPASMDECRSHYHKPVYNETHVILFQPGNSTHPAVYYCDHKKGWVLENKKLFCRHSYQPCRCVYKGDTCKGNDLLPDGRCVPACAEKRLPQNNCDCVIHTKPVRPASEDFDVPSTLLEKDTAVSHETTLSPTSVVSKINGKGGDKLPEPADVPIGIIAICVCLVGTGTIITIVICLRIQSGGSRCININRNTINIEGDLIKAKGKKNIIKFTPSDDDNQTDATNYSDQLENENANDSGQSTTLLTEVHSSDIETSESTSMMTV